MHTHTPFILDGAASIDGRHDSCLPPPAAGISGAPAESAQLAARREPPPSDGGVSLSTCQGGASGQRRRGWPELSVRSASTGSRRWERLRHWQPPASLLTDTSPSFAQEPSWLSPSGGMGPLRESDKVRGRRGTERGKWGELQGGRKTRWEPDLLSNLPVCLHASQLPKDSSPDAHATRACIRSLKWANAWITRFGIQDRKDLCFILPHPNSGHTKCPSRSGV